MARVGWKGQKQKRDGNQFVALPSVVLDSPGYRAAGHTARSLLIDIARQYNGRNNGRLVACAKYLEPLGWRSNATITSARRELVECGLLVETRKGARPNKAAWYALAWVALDVGDGLDIDPKRYRTGGYMHIAPGGNGNVHAPSGGVGTVPIAPPRGVRGPLSTPSAGAIQPGMRPCATPPNGAYLELPSA